MKSIEREMERKLSGVLEDIRENLNMRRHSNSLRGSRGLPDKEFTSHGKNSQKEVRSPGYLYLNGLGSGILV